MASEPKRAPACVTCNFFVVDTDHPATGHCHWGPPARFRDYPTPTLANWPVVQTTDWCGQWQIVVAP